MPYEAELLDDRGSCLLVALRVATGDAAVCAALLAEVNDRLAEAEGFRSLDVIRRDGQTGVDFFVLARFRDRAALEAWTASPQRNRLLCGIEALAISDVARQQGEGASIWFEPIPGAVAAPPPVPPFWKRWAVSFLAVYPALILLLALLSPVLDLLPGPLGLLLVVAILTGLTTAWIVPFLMRKLGPWLQRR